MRCLGWILCLLLPAAVLAHTPADDEPGPKEPDEAFSVYVFSNLEDEEDTKTEVEKVVKELEKRVKKHKKWFIVAKSPERAEIRLELTRHTVDEVMRHKLVSRVNVNGNGKNWVTETWNQERHFLEARFDAFGRQAILEGSDEREQGGSMKRAVENLVDNLELHCRESYAELSRLRRQ